MYITNCLLVPLFQGVDEPLQRPGAGTAVGRRRGVVRDRRHEQHVLRRAHGSTPHEGNGAAPVVRLVEGRLPRVLPRLRRPLRRAAVSRRPATHQRRPSQCRGCHRIATAQHRLQVMRLLTYCYTRNNNIIINTVFVYAIYLAVKPLRGALHFT